MELTILSLSFLFLLVLGVPVAFAIGLSSIATILYAGMPMGVVFQKMVGGMQVFSFLAIPFFIFAGEIMGFGGISRRLVDWTKSLLGGTKASLPITTVGTCVVFGAISGSSAATVAAGARPPASATSACRTFSSSRAP